MLKKYVSQTKTDGLVVHSKECFTASELKRNNIEVEIVIPKDEQNFKKIN